MYQSMGIGTLHGCMLSQSTSCKNKGKPMAFFLTPVHSMVRLIKNIIENEPEEATKPYGVEASIQSFIIVLLSLSRLVGTREVFH
jgi:hypothetical protein